MHKTNVSESSAESGALIPLAERGTVISQGEDERERC